MAPLRWHALTWDEFLSVLHDFRDRYYTGRSRPDEEHAYLRTLELLGDDRPYAELADRSRDLVWFLNQWACRLPTEPATEAIGAWIREEARSLEEHRDSNIFDARVLRRAPAYDRLHDGLLRARRRGVPNMSDAAASKVLHQLNPRLFVMWDKNIKPYAGTYGSFMRQMHELAVRLLDAAPIHARDNIEGFLQEELGYPIRKTFAKYLDEYNWYVAFGGERLAP